MNYVFSQLKEGKTRDRIDVHYKGKNVGYAVLKPYKRFWWLQGVYVHPDFRGTGLAHKLVDKAIEAHPESEVRLLVDPYRDKPLTVKQLKKFYKKHGFEQIDDEGTMARKPTMEKQGGGKILSRFAGLLSRPFVGAAKSHNIQNAVEHGITNHVNTPIENALRRSGVHKAISKAYEYGTIPVPGTPKLVQPVMPMAEQRRAYGNWRADDHIHTFAQNPEIAGALAVPVPGVTETYLAGKHLANKLLGGGVKKLAEYLPSFSEELEKTAEVAPYQQITQWTCSAACLKAVLGHYGIDITEMEAIGAIGTQKGRGAECFQIADGARKLGLDAFEWSFASLDQAKALTDADMPIICDIQSFNHPGKGHYVVLTKIDESGVHLMDPNTPGNERTISFDEMDQRWWDRAMAPPHEEMPKWGIVILPPEVGDDISG